MSNLFTLPTLTILFLLTACMVCSTNAQKSSSAIGTSDSTAKRISVHQKTPASPGVHTPGDTLHHQDSVAAVDSTSRMSTPTLVGTYDRFLQPRNVVTNEDLHWLDYRSLGGIMEHEPGVYIREQNSVGQYDQLNIRGLDWRNIAITSDGRVLNDPASGIFNLFHFTTEYADRIEIVTGPRAFIYGINSTGGAINLLTKNYNSNRPFTKLNYSEEGYGYQYSDGTFSQNISRKVNFTFGFQHQSTDGRFPHSAHDAWNARVKVRYNVSHTFNIILSEYHTSTETQMNGGVNYPASGSFFGLDPFQATLRNTESFEKITRNDVDLSLVGTFLDDTTNVSMLTLYYSHSIREYRDGENLSRGPTNRLFIESDHTTSWMGTRFSQNFDTQLQRFSLGSSVELRQIEASPNLGRRRNVVGNIWAKEELLLAEGVTVAAFGRYDRYLKGDYTGIGADATMKVLDGLSLFGGISHSRRLPTYEELYWADSTVNRVLPITAEQHMQLEAGAELTLANNSFIRGAFFHRTVTNAIQIIPYSIHSSQIFPWMTFANVPRVTTNGIELKLGCRVWILYLEGTGTYMSQTSGGVNTQLFPTLWANGGLYYWNTLLNNKLELKVGFKGTYQSSHLGAEFNPELLAYVTSAGPVLGQAASGDFFVTAHIGDAYIHVMWENLTDLRYFSSPFYPVLDRAIRLGVSWEFLN